MYLYSILILFSLLAQFEFTTDHNFSDVSEEHLCIMKATDYTKLVPKCREHAEIFDIIDDNILSKLNHISKDQLRNVITKTCTELQIELECDIIEYNQSMPCTSFKYLAEMRISMTIDKGITEFLCENNGLRVVNLIQNDGLQLIFDNDFYNSCMQHSKQEDFEIVELTAHEYHISEEYCLYLQDTYDCLRQFLITAKNIYIQKYEVELHERLMRLLKCNVYYKI